MPSSYNRRCRGSRRSNNSSELIGHSQQRQQQQAATFRGGATSRSSSSIQEFIAFVTCNSNSNHHHRDITSHLFNCGTSNDRYSQQHPPNTETTTKSTAGSMQRASVSRRTDTNPLSPGLRSRSSERHIDMESDHTMTENSSNYPTATEDNNYDITANMEKPSSSTLYRSMSDPFDSAQNDDVVGGTVGTGSDDDDDLYVLAASTSQISIQNDANTNSDSRAMNSNSNLQIPTLARYPCTENKNKNCWSEPPITIFHVRGMNYCTDQKKVPSQPYLLRSRGSDIFLTDPKKPFTLDTM
jgi:Protein ENHANCED DISEASE RESISTANCE 2, C-terminal